MISQEQNLEVSYRLSQVIGDAIDTFCKSDPQAKTLTVQLAMSALAVHIANLALALPTKEDALQIVPDMVAEMLRNLLRSTPEPFFNSKEYGLQLFPETAPEDPDT